MTVHDLAVAAVRFGDGDRIDDVLETVVRAVQSRGHTVAGYLQRETPDGPGCCSIMHLEDISSGEQVRISQALGAGSRGCRLDPRALADVSGRLLSAIGAGTDLVVLNRFGKGESDGHGFRSVIETACGFGMPVLTAVRQTYEPAWMEFTGGMGAFLPADADAVARWALQSITDRRQTRDAA
jgi:nucleoside-triphosphatase THEP1